MYHMKQIINGDDQMTIYIIVVLRIFAYTTEEGNNL